MRPDQQAANYNDELKKSITNNNKESDNDLP